MIISVSVSKEDLHLIDEYCELIGIPRSTFFIRSALKEVGVHSTDINATYPKAEEPNVRKKVKPSVRKKEPAYFNPVPKPKKGKK